ncbi:MAG TPA: class I SAM-dependent methyltransferase [Tepidisphaeraceae bacterium]
MDNGPRPSRTALVTCLMRALHTKYDRPALIEDAWADHLLTPEDRNELAAAAMGAAPAAERERLLAAAAGDFVLHAAWRSTGVYGGVVIRTRYAEEQVEAAAARGVRQYVILGAGLDSFGMRQPALARNMQVFEVDHPASQDLKRSRLSASGAAVPPTLHFVPADLGMEELGAALGRSAFRSDEPAILSWLGVTVYLTREANLATLRSIAEVTAAGSELVFTYVEQRALDSPTPVMEKALAGVSAIGEPWLSGFDSATLSEQLRKLGLTCVEDLGGRELHRRYCAGRTDGLTPGRAGRMARARTVGAADRVT